MAMPAMQPRRFRHIDTYREIAFDAVMNISPLMLVTLALAVVLAWVILMTI